MKKSRYIVWILAVEAVGALSGFLSREGMAVFQAEAVKPALFPPDFLFPLVWSVLYALMGIGAARIASQKQNPETAGSLNLFVIQLTVNFFWSLIFFNAQAYGFALVWLVLLWFLIIRMICRFRRIDAVSCWLQVPYLLWVSFAFWLNYGVWIRNP